MPFISDIPENSGPDSILNQFPEIGTPILKASLELLNGTDELPKEYCELIAAYTSGLNSCKYCYGGHTTFAEAYGIEEGLLKKLVEDDDYSDLDNKMMILLNFIKKVTRDFNKITKKDVDAVLNAGWSNEAYYQAVMICSIFNFYNRVVNSYGLELPTGFDQHIKAHVKQGGSVYDR